MIPPNLLPSLDRDKVEDFLKNRLQIVQAKGGEVLRPEDLTDYLRGQDDILAEIVEEIRKGALDLEAPQEAQEEAPDLSIHLDEAKLRAEARSLLEGMGITPMETPR